MAFLVRYPRLLFVISFVVLWLAVWGGKRLKLRYKPEEDVESDFSIIEGASLTLLGLIIGFSFSMAVSRYDQRKTYEEAEANAIGTEYLRADFLSPEEADRTRELLRRYTEKRIAFYETRNERVLQQIAGETTAIQHLLWQSVSGPAIARPSVLMSLVAGGMNDVINSEGYTQAAWWNRIPEPAWGMLFSVAILSNLLVGYGAKRMRGNFFIVLPLMISISLFLIADIDSPRWGIILLRPQNLLSLQSTLH